MATQGFEFAYMIDGSNGRPVVQDFVLGAAADHLVGDLMLVQSDGSIDAVTGTTTEVTCIMQEYVLTADVTADTTKAKAAIIQRNQVWRCSMDASTATTALQAYTQLLDTVDKNTVSASDITNGAMCLVNKSETDDEGNLIAYVVFLDTTYGNV